MNFDAAYAWLTSLDADVQRELVQRIAGHAAGPAALEGAMDGLRIADDGQESDRDEDRVPPISSSAPSAEKILPIDVKYDGRKSWAEYSRQHLQPWLVACGTPPDRWGQRSIAALTGQASNYLLQQLQDRNIACISIQAQPSLLPFDLLDSIMLAGNFGSVVTDDTVRDNAAHFSHRKWGSQWDTALHVTRYIDIINQAPHALDACTKIYFLRQSLHPKLREQLLLTHENKVFTEFDDFCTATRNLGSIFDREQNELEKQQRIHSQLQQQQYKQQTQQQRKDFYRAQAAAGSGRPFRPGFAPGAAAASSSAGAGGPIMRQRETVRYHPYQSPHADKSSYNPNLTPAEAARRKRASECFTCNAPGVPKFAPAAEHGPECRHHYQQRAPQQQQQQRDTRADAQRNRGRPDQRASKLKSHPLQVSK